MKLQKTHKNNHTYYKKKKLDVLEKIISKNVVLLRKMNDKTIIKKIFISWLLLVKRSHHILIDSEKN